MKVLYLWTEINAYSVSCMSALNQRGNVEAMMVAGSPGAVVETNQLDDSQFEHLPVKLLLKGQLNSASNIAQVVSEFEPDAICVGGWHTRGYRKFAHHPVGKKSRLFLMSDNPFRGDLKQRIAPIALRRFLNRMEKIIVPGERGWQYARHLGFSEAQIAKGLYGVNFRELREASLPRFEAPQDWPRTFLFAGSLIHRKGIDLLAKAYELYRNQSSNPWRLVVAGAGELHSTIASVPGVDMQNFVQPSGIPGLMAQSGCLVLPSRYDAWPLVVVEACASGLPVVCSAACGSSVEVIRDFYNGRICQTGSATELTRAFHWIESHYSELPSLGLRSQQLAAPYSTEAWAERMEELLLH